MTSSYSVDQRPHDDAALLDASFADDEAAAFDVGTPTSSALPRRVVGRVPEILAIVAGLGLWTAGAMTREIAAPDNVSYLSIADHWAAGRIDEAINGYWSPLYSWLLVPFAWLDVPALVSEPLLGLLFLVLTIDRLRVLCRRVCTSGRAQVLSIEILLVGALPFLLFATVALLGPDQLLALLVVTALAALLDEHRDPVRRGLAFGGWSALAYLTKSFALPFLLSVGVVWIVISRFRLAWDARRSRRTTTAQGAPDGDANVQGARDGSQAARFRRQMFAGLLGLGVIAVVTVAWGVVLSVHYGEVTISRTATYHAQITAPGAQGNPYYWAGLLEPTHDRAISAWEDPTVAQGVDGEPIDLSARAGSDDVPVAVDQSDDSPIGSDGSVVEQPAADIEGSNVRDRADRFVDNLGEAVRPTAKLAGTTVVAGLGAILALIAVGSRRRRRATDDDDRAWAVVVLLVAAAIYVFGISLVVVVDRYMWPPMLLTVPVATWTIDTLRRRFAWSTRVFLAVITVIAVASGVRATVALESFSRVAGYGEPLIASAEVIEPGTRVASLVPHFGFMGVCRNAGCTYWGAPIATTGPALAAELGAADIDYLVVEATADSALEQVELAGAEVYAEPDDRLTILDVRRAGNPAFDDGS